jgi:hypothetical protein
MSIGHMVMIEASTMHDWFMENVGFIAAAMSVSRRLWKMSD